jgi:hypothetical protein
MNVKSYEHVSRLETRQKAGIVNQKLSEVATEMDGAVLSA